jgi:hypothetical protein
MLLAAPLMRGVRRLRDADDYDIMRTIMTSITDTQLKLRDAATQMKLALDHIDNEDVFRSCINSYISTARSVTFVMEKESSEDPELKSWYKAQMAALGQLAIMRFFHEQRTHTIHRGIVKPDSKRFPVYNLVVNGEKKSGTAEGWAWYFPDAKKYMPGDTGNVPRLCEQYFLILKRLIYEWLQQKAQLKSNDA